MGEEDKREYRVREYARVILVVGTALFLRGKIILNVTNIKLTF